MVGDTPPGPPSEVAAPLGCSPRFVEGTGRVSVCENIFENASRDVVPMNSVAAGSRTAPRFVNYLEDTPPGPPCGVAAPPGCSPRLMEGTGERLCLREHF